MNSTPSCCHSSGAPANNPPPAADAPVYMGLPDERVLRPRFWIALACTLPVLALAMGPMLTPSVFHGLDPHLSGWLQLALAAAGGR